MDKVLLGLIATTALALVAAGSILAIRHTNQSSAPVGHHGPISAPIPAPTSTSTSPSPVATPTTPTTPTTEPYIPPTSTTMASPTTPTTSPYAADIAQL